MRTKLQCVVRIASELRFPAVFGKAFVSRVKRRAHEAARRMLVTPPQTKPSQKREARADLG